MNAPTKYDPVAHGVYLLRHRLQIQTDSNPQIIIGDGYQYGWIWKDDPTYWNNSVQALTTPRRSTTKHGQAAIRLLDHLVPDSFGTVGIMLVTVRSTRLLIRFGETKDRGTGTKLEPRLQLAACMNK